jgi:transposase
MRQKPGTRKSHGEKVVKDIRRATRKQYSAEEKIRIVLDGLKGEDSIAELYRREGIAQSLAIKKMRMEPLDTHTERQYAFLHGVPTSIEFMTTQSDCFV